MEVKEAIEFCELIKKDLKRGINYLKDKGLIRDENYDVFDGIISLLQDLEKYKTNENAVKINYNTMVKRVEELVEENETLKEYKEMWGRLRTDNYYCYREMQPVIENIEQKYFFQPVKKVITIEVKAEGKDDVYWLNRYAKELNMNLPDRFKVNIKEEVK